MKTPKTKTTNSSQTPAEQSRLRRLQIEKLREITERILAKCGKPMTAAEIRSAKRKSRRTKNAK